MEHIRYISDDKTVCGVPERLGYDLVTSKYDLNGQRCRICSQLLAAHNERMFKEELKPSMTIYTSAERSDGITDPVKSFLLGIVLASLFWLILIAALWMES